MINIIFILVFYLAIREVSDQISFLSDSLRWLGFLPWLVLNAQCQKLPDCAGFGSCKLEPCPLRQPTHMHQESCYITYCKPETLYTRVGRCHHRDVCQPLMIVYRPNPTEHRAFIRPDANITNFWRSLVSHSDFRLSALELSVTSVLTDQSVRLEEHRN